MRNYVLMFLFVSFVSYGIEAFILDNVFDHDCKEGEFFWKSCFECKCHNNHRGCWACGGQCAGKNIDSRCSVGNPTTAAPVAHSGACDELKVFEAVALMQFVYNDYGQRCSDGSSHDNDALVMTLCSAPPSSKWVDGEHVWRNHKCSPNLKPFTPIYFHEGNTKYPAILLSCSDTEIKNFLLTRYMYLIDWGYKRLRLPDMLKMLQVLLFMEGKDYTLIQALTL